ncbi:hypothetical protein DN730_10775 [Marinomonas piezotolerans]|uniref:Uncharacterized protein n=1 Tax=Marinomonas piezotolerans TaxID=2213058 RepID=A0A370U8I2_9GAMM|nr:hypothetical protein DN730_10775 [Marinomonas piezotolerans]
MDVGMPLAQVHSTLHAQALECAANGRWNAARRLFCSLFRQCLMRLLSADASKHETMAQTKEIA